MTEVPQPIEGYNECEWPIDPACLVGEWAAYDDEVQTRAKALAASTLRRLTGYRVGGCPVTVRPCTQGCAEGYIVRFWDYGQDGSFYPLNNGGRWTNSCSSGCGGCLGHASLTLPQPIGEVYEVKIDGEVFTDYYISGGMLVRTDGQEWPTTQWLTHPDTQVGTWSVTYLNSWPVDNLGAYAAGILAMEFAKACSGTKCRLPAGVTAVTRQGVSFEVQTGSFPGGFTNIREVDAFIAMWNPNGLRQQPTIIIPGQKNRPVQRWGGVDT